MQLIDTNKYYLNGTRERFLHLSTVHMGLREFMCFQDISDGKIYIEEMVGGKLLFVEDDSLASALEWFLTEKGILSADTPGMPDHLWRQDPKHTKYFS
jgi:hypothetical protein